VRLSELREKEVIDIVSGERLGLLEDADLLVDPRSGRIEAVILPAGGGLRRKREEVVVPWHLIRRIGSDMVLVELVPGRAYLPS